MSCGVKIILYIAYHDTIPQIKSDCLVPIYSGRKDGDNIGDNSNYCELRAQYWAWKNGPSCDYIGFFHPRRFLASYGLIKLPTCFRPTPYKIYKSPDEKAYTEERLVELLKGVDVVAPVKEYTGIKVYQNYSTSKRQRASDLDLIREIIYKEYPEFSTAVDEYLNGEGEYYGNIYIMKYAYFEQYCAWLFSVLSKFDTLVFKPMPQTDGLLGERLFGIFFTWLQMQSNVQCGELPRLFFSDYDDENHNFRLRAFINYIFPPSSEQRSMLNRIRYNLRKLDFRSKLNSKM